MNIFKALVLNWKTNGSEQGKSAVLNCSALQNYQGWLVGATELKTPLVKHKVHQIGINAWPTLAASDLGVLWPPNSCWFFMFIPANRFL